MANYDDIKKKARDVVDTLADVSVEAYRLAEDKAKVFAKKAKLNAGIANERALIRRLKVEIGGTYYKLHKDDAEDTLKQYCDGITLSLDRISAKQRELEELKNTNFVEEEAEAEEGECTCGCTEETENTESKE